MKIRQIEGTLGLAALMVATASVSVPLYADSAGASGSGATTSPWLSLAGQAWMNYTSPLPLLTATFTSQSTSQTNATAFATVHNIVGQTVAIETVPIVRLNPGQNVTVGFYLTVPFDAYTVDLFVLSSSGTLISAVTNSTVVA